MSESSSDPLQNVMSLSLLSDLTHSQATGGSHTTYESEFESETESEASVVQTESFHTARSDKYTSGSFETVTPSDSCSTHTDSYSTSSFDSESEDGATYSSSFVSSDTDTEEENHAAASFFDKKIKLLKNPPIVAKKPTSRRKKKEPKEQNAYCSRKISSLHSDKEVKVSRPLHYPSVLDTVGELPINVRVLEKMRAENVIMSLKRANEEDFHVPKKCTDCRKKITEFAHQKFIREKMSLLAKHSTEKRLDKHAYTRDSITLIGDIMKSLPTLRDNPDVVWKRLTEPLTATQNKTPT